MRWTNYHGHSQYCDGHGEMEDYIIKAIELNMASLGFSSHAPVPFPTQWTMPLSKLKEYNCEIERLKEKYREQIVLFRSLEVDFIPGLTSPTHKLIKEQKLDYVIGSIHFVGRYDDGNYWDLDGPLEDIKRGLDLIFGSDIKKAVEYYFQMQNEMLDSHTPDILGHMDKIKMHNAMFSLFEESEGWYVDQVKQTLMLAKEKGSIVEINTKTFENYGYSYPSKEHFKFIKDNNIPITINSDAHVPDLLISGYKDVAEMLLNSGVREVFQFVNRSWVPVELMKDGVLI